MKKKAKAINAVAVSTNYYNSQTEQILTEINDEYFKAQAGLKKDFILKAAKRLKELGLPKKTI